MPAPLTVVRLSAKSFTSLFGLALCLFLAGCGGPENSSNPDTSAPARILLTEQTATGSNEKAQQQNLLDLNQAWTTWSGKTSGVIYDPASESLRIPASDAGTDLVVAVRRFELPLMPGRLYTLRVNGTRDDVAAIPFLFDTSGAIVAVPGYESLAVARQGYSVSFVAPENIAGLYLQVQNGWQSDQEANLIATLVQGPDDPVTVQPELIDSIGRWRTWSDNDSGIEFDSSVGALVIPGPDAGQSARVGVRRFDAELTEGTTYELSVLQSAAPHGAVMLFLFDPNGSLIPFVDTESGQQRSWLQATTDSSRQFVAPRGVSGFAVQVQSAWNSPQGTSLLPSLKAVSEPLACVRQPVVLGSRTVLDADNGMAPDREAGDPSVSDDGRFVVFESRATNYLPDTTLVQNGSSRIYMWDRQTGDISLIGSDTTAPHQNRHPKISGDGRFVVFLSNHQDLITEDPAVSGAQFLYRWSRETDQIVRVSPNRAGFNVQGNSGSTNFYAISGDGQRIVFYMRDAQTWFQDAVAAGNAVSPLVIYDAGADELSFLPIDGTAGASWYMSSLDLSADGRYLVFSGNPFGMTETVGQSVRLIPSSVYLADLALQTMTEVGSTGVMTSPTVPVISADGQWVSFISSEPLAGGTESGLFLWERESQFFQRVNPTDHVLNISSEVAISRDGRTIVYPGQDSFQTLGGTNLFVTDMTNLGTQGVAAPATAGDVVDVSVSADGTVIVFDGDKAPANGQGAFAVQRIQQIGLDYGCP